MDAVAIRLILWVGVFVLMMSYVFAVDYPQPVKVIMAIFGTSMSWAGVRSVLSNCYSGLEMMKYPSYGTMAETMFVSAVGIGALLLGVGAIGFSIVTVAGGFVGFLICVKFTSIFVTELPAIEWRKSVEMLRDGVPYFLNTLFGMIYYRIDTVMLSLMVPEYVVGWYGAAYRFFDSLMFVPLIVTGAVFPVMARLWGKEKDSMNRAVQKSLDWILIAGVPISVTVFAFSHEIILFFYGLEGYNSSVLLLKIFAVGSLLLYVDVIIGSALLASDKQRQLSVNAFLAILINVGLNYVLIPRFQVAYGNGAIGSAIATVLTEFYVMTRLSFLMPNSILGSLRILTQVKALCAGLLMAGALWMMQSLTFQWFVQAVAASAVFLIALFAFRTFESSDLALIEAFVPRKLMRKRISGGAG